MSNSYKGPRFYYLAETVKIFHTDPEEIRLRKGVWSHTEAVIRLYNRPESVASFFQQVMQSLSTTGLVDVNEVAQRVAIKAGDVQTYCSVLDDIVNQGFLFSDEKNRTFHMVNAILGGNATGFEKHIAQTRPVLFIADTAYCTEAARKIATDISIPMDVISPDIYKELSQWDLTNKYDPVLQSDLLDKFTNVFAPYSCVVATFSLPKVVLLRNINRVLLSLKKPLVLGLIDGPFASIIVTAPPETGCFECYEQRILARLEDTAVYEKYVANDKPIGEMNAAVPSNALALHMLTAAVISEGVLLSSISMSRVVGRCINIYLPVLEIQVEDLLRVPYCPACGAVSRIQMDEMYTSSQAIMTELLNKIEIEGE